MFLLIITSSISIIAYLIVRLNHDFLDRPLDPERNMVNTVLLGMIGALWTTYKAFIGESVWMKIIVSIGVIIFTIIFVRHALKHPRFKK
jgi:hypothetical protein|nr:MAG TPA: hypothetical protein [Caudoviricetes sp.]